MSHLYEHFDVVASTKQGAEIKLARDLSAIFRSPRVVQLNICKLRQVELVLETGVARKVRREGIGHVELFEDMECD